MGVVDVVLLSDKGIATISTESGLAVAPAYTSGVILEFVPE